MESSPIMPESDKGFDIRDFFREVNEKIDELVETRPDDAPYYDEMRGFADPTIFSGCDSRHRVVDQIEEEIRYEHDRGDQKDQGRIDALDGLKTLIRS